MSQFWEESVPWSFRDLKERPSYEERRRMRYTLQGYQQRVVGFVDWKGKKVLEVGCGAGLDAVEFARMGARVTATDSSIAALEETIKTAREAGVVVDVPRDPIRAYRLPFLDEAFDLVYCFGVLHHLPYSQARRAVKEFARVLKPDGTCIAMLYNRDSLLYAYSIEHLGLPFERAGNPPDTRAYTRREALELFAAGFGDVSISTHYQVIDLPNQRKVKLGIPEELGLGWHHIIRGTKA